MLKPHRLIDKNPLISPTGVGTQERTVKRHKAKRGRPSPEQVLSINREIIAAAVRCFLAQGYEGTSMDSVAIEAGVSKVTLYARYPKKNVLLSAALEDRLSAWSQENSTLAATAGYTLEKRLKYYVRIVMTWSVSADIRAFDRLINGAPLEISQPLYQTRNSQSIDRLTFVIKQCTHAEGLPARNARRVASDLMSLLVGWIRLETLTRTVPTRDAVRFGNHAVDLMIAARQAW